MTSTLSNNGFSLNLVQSVIRIKISNFNKIKTVSTLKCPVHLCLPRRVNISNKFTKQISSVVQRCYFSTNIQVVFFTKPILTSIKRMFSLPIIMALLNCDCGLHYIERTNQRLDVRIKQHVPKKIQNFTYFPTDTLNNTYVSSITDHLINKYKCSNTFSVNLFSILSNAHTPFHQKILEAISHQDRLPSINRGNVGLDLMYFLSTHFSLAILHSLHIVALLFFFILELPWL